MQGRTVKAPWSCISLVGLTQDCFLGGRETRGVPSGYVMLSCQARAVWSCGRCWQIGGSQGFK